MTTALHWRSLQAPSGRREVKGTELAQAIVPGTNSRFAVCEAVALDAEGNRGVNYRLRDADTVSDADLRMGRRPKIVGVYETPEDAVTAALKMMETEQ